MDPPTTPDPQWLKRSAPITICHPSPHTAMITRAQALNWPPAHPAPWIQVGPRYAPNKK